MIHRGSNTTAVLRHGRKTITYVYHGFVKIYQAIRSCFGSGVWISNRPWIGSDKWKNNR